VRPELVRQVRRRALLRRAVCRPLLQPGEACTDQSQCAGPLPGCIPCDNGLRCCIANLVGLSCSAETDCVMTAQIEPVLFCSQLSHTCQLVHRLGEACDPADSADQCIHTPLGMLSSACDATTKTCQGGYCEPQASRSGSW
jgi:hypothetical protein